MDDIRLYSFALSPFALKVRSYLLFLGVDFETIYVHPMDMRDPKNPGELKDLDSMKEVVPCGQTIPALTINGDCLNESTENGIRLSELYPDKALIPKDIESLVLEADNWVTQRLINLTFRDSLGFDDSLGRRMKKRWTLSRVLNLTVPTGVSLPFRLMHALFVSRSFVSAHVEATDTSKRISQVRQEMAEEFQALLSDGPFLCGSDAPTLADLSAYPQIVKPKVIDNLEYLLPGSVVSDWVTRMEKHIPNLKECFPGKIRHKD